jgi:hypothetical protein
MIGNVMLRLAIDAILVAIGMAAFALLAPDQDVWKSLTAIMIGIHVANTHGRMREREEARKAVRP